MEFIDNSKNHSAKYCSKICKNKRDYLFTKEKRKIYGEFYRKNNVEKINEQRLNWKLKNPEKELISYNLSHKKYFNNPDNKTKILCRNILNNDKEKNPNKYKNRFCEICQSKINIEFHHNSYEKGQELNVISLCALHHKWVHKELNGVLIL